MVRSHQWESCVFASAGGCVLVGRSGCKFSPKLSLLRLSSFVRSSASASVCVFLCVRALANTARMGQLSHTNLCVLWVSLVRSLRSALWQPAQTHTRGQVFARASLGVAAARNSTGKLASTFQRQAANNNDDDCCSSAAALRIVFPRVRGRLARTFVVVVVVGGGAEIRRPRRVVCGMCARARREQCVSCAAAWQPGDR